MFSAKSWIKYRSNSVRWNIGLFSLNEREEVWGVGGYGKIKAMDGNCPKHAWW